MRKFNLSPRPDFNCEIEPAVNKVQFGDGYVQRQKKGINNILRKYSPVFKVKTEEVSSIDTFFAEHSGIDPFLWFNPVLNKEVKIICSKWSYSSKKDYSEITCEFEETL